MNATAASQEQVSSMGVVVGGGVCERGTPESCNLVVDVGVSPIMILLEKPESSMWSEGNTAIWCNRVMCHVPNQVLGHVCRWIEDHDNPHIFALSPLSHTKKHSSFPLQHADAHKHKHTHMKASISRTTLSRPQMQQPHASVTEQDQHIRTPCCIVRTTRADGE